MCVLRDTGMARNDREIEPGLRRPIQYDEQD